MLLKKQAMLNFTIRVIYFDGDYPIYRVLQIAISSGFKTVRNKIKLLTGGEIRLDLDLMSWSVVKLEGRLWGTAWR